MQRARDPWIQVNRTATTAEPMHVRGAGVEDDIVGHRRRANGYGAIETRVGILVSEPEKRGLRKNST